MATIQIGLPPTSANVDKATSQLRLFALYYSCAALGVGMVGAGMNAVGMLPGGNLDRTAFVHFYLLPIGLVQVVIKMLIPDMADRWFLGGVKVKPAWASGILWRHAALNEAMSLAAYAIYPTPTVTKLYWMYAVASYALMNCYVNATAVSVHPYHVLSTLLGGVTFLGFWLT